MSEPLVSIGIPTYNRSTDLGRAIRSALAQEYRNLEVVVCDNASTDGTEALCRELAAHEPRIRYLRQATNEGPGPNFRRALAESRGELFMWLGDDDWIDPSYVSHCAEVLMRDSSCSLACGVDHYYVDDKLEREGTNIDLGDATGIGRVLSYYRQVTMNGAFYGVMRTQEIARVPMYEKLLAADWLMVAALAYRGKIKTLASTSLHRTLAGQSRDWTTLLSTLPLSDFQKQNYGLTIASSVFNDIAWRSPVYEAMGRPQRLAFATRAAYVVARRHYSVRSHAATVAARLSESFQRRR